MFDKRSVVNDGQEYVVEVLPASPAQQSRLGRAWYALVELPGVWQAVLPAPDGIKSAAEMWYRDLVKLVDQAQQVVSMRRAS